MATLLLKTEPSEYSFDDLVREKRAVWSGVKNAQALAVLRTAQKGDRALIYHTGDEKSIVGLAIVTRGPYPDPELKDDKLVVIDLKPVQRAKEPVTLARVKADERFATFALVKQSRLSVMQVPAAMDRILSAWCGFET